jgi:DNA-binding beta-propeller fold protein YncE
MRPMVFIALIALLLRQSPVQTPAPLSPLPAMVMPEVPLGPYTDHLAVDVKRHRLFTTPQARKSVQVFDLDSGRLIENISGFANPHSILYRSDLDRIYVTDGGAGELKIFDGRDYQPLESVALLADADSIGYDTTTKCLYVTSGGAGARLDYSLLSIIDTTTAKRMGDIKVAARSLEAMAIEGSSPRIYIDLTDKDEVAVIDREKQSVVAIWPLSKGKKNIAIALDETHHRLFVGCRDTEISGAIVVFDTKTGKEIDALPIGGWVDYLAYDPGSERIYATCGANPGGQGAVYVFRRNNSGQFTRLAVVPSAPRAKTGLLVPELARLFVSVPHFAETPAKILVFRVN